MINVSSKPAPTSRISLASVLVTFCCLLAIGILIVFPVEPYPLPKGWAQSLARWDQLKDTILVLCCALVYFLSRQRLAFQEHWRDSARKAAEDYRLLLEGINDAAFIYPFLPDGAPGRLHAVSQMACRLLGYSEHELLTLTLSDLIPTEFRDMFHPALDTLNEGVSDSVPLELISRDGKRVPTRMTFRLSRITKNPVIVAIAQNQQATQQLEKAFRITSERLRALTNASSFAIIGIDMHGNVTEWNAIAEECFGWKKHEIEGQPLPIVSKSELQELCSSGMKANERTASMTVERSCRKRDGSMTLVRTSIGSLFDDDGHVDGLLLAITDLSDARATEQQMNWMHTALRLLAEVKRSIVCASDEVSLLESMCRIIVKIGGYRLAWVGYPVKTRSATMLPAAWHGCENGQNAVTVMARDVREADNPAGIAMQTGNAVIRQHLLTSPSSAPWVAEALNCGFGSVIALPLVAGWQPLGVLTICSAEATAFDPAEAELLSVLADDISHGIQSIRTRVEHEQATRSLGAAAQQWQATFDAIHDPIIVVDQHQQIVRCNAATVAMLGKPTTELLRGSCCQGLHDETVPTNCLFDQVWENGVAASEELSLDDHWYRVTVNPLFDPKGQVSGAIHVMDDITEYKHADEKLQRNISRVQTVLDCTITAIAKIVEMRDPYTAGHEQRVSELACAIAREMALDESAIEGLRVAGMLHDIGKLYVPSELLSRPTKLQEYEFALIKAHAQAGYDILQTIDFPWPVADFVHQHHERLNGTGYPQGLCGDAIHLESRILAVADVVESMVSHRPYRPALGMESALQEIQTKRESHYDPAVVDACVRIIQDKKFSFEI